MPDYLQDLTREEAVAALCDDVERASKAYLERAKIECAQRYDVLRGLYYAGAIDSISMFSARYSTRIIVQADKLPAIRQQFPRCADTREYEAHSASENTVKVYLDLGVETAGVKVCYVRELPPDSPCKFVEQEYPSGKTKQLVCGVKP